MLTLWLQMRLIKRISMMLVISLWLAPNVQANDTTDWMVLVSPFVWGASLSGDLGIAGQQAAVEAPFSTLFKDIDSVFMGNIELTNRQFGLYVDATYVHSSRQDKALAQPLQVSLRQKIFTVGGFYRLYSQALAGETAFGEPRRFAIEPTLGLRRTQIKAGLTAPTLGVDLNKKAQWTDPFIGARMSLDLDRHWNLSGLVDVGGWDTQSKKTHSAELYLGYRTFLAEYPVLVRAGYRSLTQRYQTEDFTGQPFTYHMRQAGPVLGVTLRL